MATLKLWINHKVIRFESFNDCRGWQIIRLQEQDIQAFLEAVQQNGSAVEVRIEYDGSKY